MPLYEYICEADGTVIELIRPMADADKPVPDPEGKGRTFKRMLSVFAPKGSAGSAPSSGGGGCCPCGKGAGQCRTRNN
jgi:putative FmdB family regulatory protein